MARLFKDSRSLMDHLVDRLEAGIASPTAYPDHEGFISVSDSDLFEKELAAAERAGGITVTRHKSGRRRGEMKFVRIADATRLYEYTGRQPSVAAATDAVSDLLGDGRLGDKSLECVGLARDVWGMNKAWLGINPGDVSSLASLLLLAQGIAAGDQAGLDYRTFSRRATGNSKALEKLAASVVKALSFYGVITEAGTPKQMLARLGLEKISPPVLMSGPLLLDGQPLPQSLKMLGIMPDDLEALGFSSTPRYVLTIENYTSFVRHVSEADPEREGLTLYGSGYSSLGFKAALRRICSQLPPEVPFYHWSDIDPDGIGIFIDTQKAIDRPLRPHLMDHETAEKFGEAPRMVATRLPEAKGTLIEECAAYLASPGAKYMEQEELDPSMPCNFR